MNKAFVREPEDNGQAFCPRCTSLGIPVVAATLEAQLKPEALTELSETAWCCPFPTCEVAYFDLFERVALLDALRAPVYPKDSSAPICPCFGFSTEEIEQDLAESGVQRTKAHVQRAKESRQCLTKSPTGQSCIADVQRYYMKRRGN
jgi:hypothetical protein